MSFLKTFLEHSKDEIWGKIANDIGGTFENGGLCGRDVLRYSSGEWEITLDTYTVNSGNYRNTYTRMRAPFVNKDKLYFKIYREGVLSTIAKAFGMKEIEIGDKFFDMDFIIKGNNEEKIKLLLDDHKLKELIRKQPDICFEIKNDDGWFAQKFPNGVDELYFQCSGDLENEELLKSLFEMFCITLQRLVQIDSAYESDPNVKIL